MGTDIIRGPKATNGKGAIYDKRPNPFVGSRTTTSAPELAGVGMLGKAVDAVLACGCALMVGHTRDGGALVLTILDGQDRYRTYCSNQDELDAAVSSAYEMYKSD